MSNYRITETADAFRVEKVGGRLAPGLPIVTVSLRPWVLRVDAGDSCVGTAGLFQGHLLIDHVTWPFAAAWEPLGPASFPNARHWVARRIRLALAGRIREQRLRLLERVPPEVVAVQRRIFATTFHSAWLAEEEEFYRARFLVRDVVRHRAAAVAVTHVGRLGGIGCPAGVRFPGLCGPADVRIALDHLENWQGLFSPTRRPYRSLSRTLMNLPRLLPSDVLCDLGKVTLECPVTERLPLAALCTLASIADAEQLRSLEDLVHILHHATPAEVANAVTAIGRRVRRPLNPRRTADVAFAMRFVADFPTRHRGRLAGIVEKAIRWHDAYARLQAETEADFFAAAETVTSDSATAPPLCGLPDIPGISFLDSVGAILDEGRRMRHCVATYAARAVAGKCHLFHVELRGETATVEVSPDGAIRQNVGPDNSVNAAALWGGTELQRWWAKRSSVAANLGRAPTVDGAR